MVLCSPSIGRGAARFALALALLPGTAAVLPVQAQTIPLTLGAFPPEDVVPLAQGGAEKALADLPASVDSTLRRSGVPGAAVAVVQGGKTVFARGFGVRELGKPAPIDTATVFQLASLSKPIAATVVAAQVTAGVVAWDDRIVKHMPGFALKDPYVTAHVTVGDMFAHRSGLPHAGGDTLEDLGFDRNTILQRLRLLPLAPFRISYAYSNFGLTTGAEAVARASGQSWEELSQKALYGPLGMTATSSRHADLLKHENRAVLHSWEGGHFAALLQRDADPEAPAGGVSSNVTDLAAWMKLVLANGRHNGQELIAPAALLPALRAQAFSSPAPSIGARSGFYGFGFNVTVDADGRPAMSHSGAFSVGAGTTVRFLPSADIAIVVLTNGGPVGVAEAIASQFMDTVQYGAPTRDWYDLFHPRLMTYYDPAGDLAGKTAPANPAKARPAADYVGTYQSAYFGPARISQGANGLVLSLGPGKLSMPLTHWDGDTYAVAPRSENATYGSRSSVRFVVRKGRVVELKINYLDGEGLATWTR
ncbi:hypothetical protein GCM10007301_38890 [Azorhizobium oxalatiphilum]|uniref:Serine hydrolase n=1 Tax=Azorhizobium oxalatiphilum TaxID=980631 RepID=A0A917FFV1_9HYPH|nr:serine hydrolase [Azorhizobium oxalatiphilum]GGF75235.1 hypothetical protein GCM10007301_38890 [Azorhizobium oxalatiphilum]